MPPLDNNARPILPGVLVLILFKSCPKQHAKLLNLHAEDRECQWSEDILRAVMTTNKVRFPSLCVGKGERAGEGGALTYMVGYQNLVSTWHRSLNDRYLLDQMAT